MTYAPYIILIYICVKLRWSKNYNNRMNDVSPSLCLCLCLCYVMFMFMFMLCYVMFMFMFMLILFECFLFIISVSLYDMSVLYFGQINIFFIIIIIIVVVVVVVIIIFIYYNCYYCYYYFYYHYYNQYFCLRALFILWSVDHVHIIVSNLMLILPLLVYVFT